MLTISPILRVLFCCCCFQQCQSVSLVSGHRSANDYERSNVTSYVAYRFVHLVLCFTTRNRRFESAEYCSSIPLFPCGGWTADDNLHVPFGGHSNRSSNLRFLWDIGRSHIREISCLVDLVDVYCLTFKTFEYFTPIEK